MTSASSPILDIRHVHKTYKLGRVKVPVLHGVDLSMNQGEWVAILGASGSGKSTLMHIAGGLDRPTRESASDNTQIIFDQHEVTRMSRRSLDRYRSTTVGFVFQFYHLLPELSVLQNVTIGAMIRYGRFGYGSKRKEIEDRAKDLLDRFGLSHRLKHRSKELSGGERQRVAIARALINEPRLLLADEPTGNLDRKTGDAILDVLAEFRQQHGLTTLMVTHDQHVADRADRVVRLIDGRVAESDAEIQSA